MIAVGAIIYYGRVRYERVDGITIYEYSHCKPYCLSAILVRKCLSLSLCVHFLLLFDQARVHCCLSVLSFEGKKVASQPLQHTITLLRKETPDYI